MSKKDEKNHYNHPWPEWAKYVKIYAISLSVAKNGEEGYILLGDQRTMLYGIFKKDVCPGDFIFPDDCYITRFENLLDCKVS